MYRSSFSQHILFEKCPYSWYLSYIKRIPVVSDLTHAKAGDAVHKTLQFFYENKNKSLQEIKDFFNKKWLSNKLDETKLVMKQDTYWLMVLNGIGLKDSINPTSTEFKIYYDDGVAYLDIIDTNNHFIGDWKTSVRTQENEEEYRKQMLFYSYMYYRKFGQIPKKVTVYYLRYNGSKVEYTIIPLMNDILNIENWYNGILGMMEDIINRRSFPGKCSECHYFCPYKNYCFSNEKCIKYTVKILNSFVYLEGPITEKLNKVLHKKYSYELKNSYFIKKHNSQINTTIDFWNEKRRLLPIGFKDSLLKLMERYGDHMKRREDKEIVVDIVDERIFNEETIKMPDKFINGKVMRDYQNEAVDTFLKHKIGTMEIATGAGKTEIATEVIRRTGYKTLFVVDKRELLLQTKKRIEDSLGIEVGQIGYGEEDIKPISVATIQTLTKHLNRYKEYFKSIRMVIFDECHHVSANTYQRLANYLPNTEYRMGLCLHKQTNVLCEGGHIKNIRDIKKGDIVLSYNINKKIIENDVVKNTFISSKEYCYVIKVKTNKGIRVIKCSEEHNFFVNGKYISTSNLKVNDELELFLQAHNKLDNNSKKQEIKEKISNRLKRRKNTWYNKNKKLFKKGRKTWNKGLTKEIYPKISSHRKGISQIEEYGLEKANQLKEQNSLSQRKAWKEKRESILYKRNRTLSKHIKYPWLSYNSKIKIKEQTDENNNIFCEHCKNIIKGYKKVHIHHKDKNRINNSLNNLIVVCAKCHTFLDNHKRDKNGRFAK